MKELWLDQWFYGLLADEQNHTHKQQFSILCDISFPVSVVLWHNCTSCDFQGEPASSDARKFGVKTLWHWSDRSELSSAEVSKDSSDLSAELSHPIDKSVSPEGPKCLAIFWVKLTVSLFQMTLHKERRLYNYLSKNDLHLLACKISLS